MLKARLAKELEEVLKRRQQIATDRISQAEADAVEAVRLLTVDIALNATEQILSETIKGKKGGKLISNSIKELPKKLN